MIQGIIALRELKNEIAASEAQEKPDDIEAEQETGKVVVSDSPRLLYLHLPFGVVSPPEFIR